MTSLHAQLVYSITRVAVRQVFNAADNLPRKRALAEQLDRSVGWFDQGFEREDVGLGNGLNGQWIIPKVMEPQHVILYLHGGGFTMRSPYLHGRFLARICQQVFAKGLMPDYRLAPEHPFPAAQDDTLYAYQWLLEQGYRPEDIAVVGDSAGGTLTLGLLLAARDAGLPLPACAVMMSPSLDPTLSGKSAEENAEVDSMLSLESIRVFIEAYMPDMDVEDPRVKPLEADFHGLPPLLFQAGGKEILRDDAVRAAEKALEQGVKAQLEVWPGMEHVFQTVEILPESRQAVGNIIDFLNSQWKEGEV